MLRFDMYEDIKNIKDSMQFDVGTVICEFEDNSYRVSVEVQGSVEVIWNDKCYRTPSEFPKELMKMVETGEIYHDSSQVKLTGVNWFDVAIYTEEGIYCPWDMVNIVGYDERELFELCLEMRDLCKRMQKELNFEIGGRI